MIESNGWYGREERMKITTLLTVCLFVSCTQNLQKENSMMPPTAEKIPRELTVHGHTRIDDYYWMRLTDEQKNANEPDDQTQKVVDYMGQENAYTEAGLKQTKQFQEKLFDEIVGRVKKDDSTVPYFKNGYWYYRRYEEGQEYPIHARKKSSLEAAEEILLNVNEMAEGQDFYQVTGLTVSQDNRWLSFGVDTVSRRLYAIHFKNLETGEILEETIPNTTGSAAWANDNKTVFYTAKDEITLLSERIYRHRVGTNSDTDVLVYEEKDVTFYNGVYKSKSDKYIIIRNSSTLVSDYHILAADNPEGEFRHFSPRETEHEYNIDHYGDEFYIVTNWDANNFRLMKTAEQETSKENWREVIPHRDEVLLEGIELFRDNLVVSEREAGLKQLRIINQRTGDEHYLDFGEAAYSAYISVNPEFDTDLLRYSYTSLTTPSSTYDYNMISREKTLKKQQEVVGGHDPGDYITERIYADSRDGKKVPISLVYRKGFEKNGKGNLLLYAYGSYGSTRDPSFGSSRLSLLDRGFVYAIAHIRGGQIYGRQWYEDGKLFNKKNTFTDFVDCAQFLINEKYTSPGHLFAMGGSAGGLLMGAIVNMQPDLFKGAVAAVPFVDVITTMLDPSIPLTSNEWDEWGDPRKKEYYDYMLSYSPYDNVEAKEYPNMLVTTGYFDSQVQYWEPLKWVAKLRSIKTGENILYLHANMDAGHGGKSGRFRRYREVALEYAFMFDLVGITR